MSAGPQSSELYRREQVWKQAIEEANAAGALLQEGQISGARDMLGYFEKLALFDASASALVITFIGSAKRALTPVWGVRAGLVLLLLGVVGAMLRNWCYFRYFIAVRQASYLQAQAKEQAARGDYYEIVPRGTNLQTGKSLNKAEFKSQIAEANNEIETKVSGLQRMESRNWQCLVGERGSTIYSCRIGIARLCCCNQHLVPRKFGISSLGRRRDIRPSEVGWVVPLSSNR